MKVYTLWWPYHPEKDATWYAGEQERKTEDVIARELDINYALSKTGRVFSNFTESRHVESKRFSYNPHRPVYRVFDFGRVNATLYAQVDSYGRKRILHERVLEASTTPEQADVANQDSKERFPDAEFIDICDPAGSWKDERGNSTDVSILESEGIYPSFDRISELPTKERKKRARAMVNRDLQKSTGGHETFIIYDGDGFGCPILKKAMMGAYGYKVDVNGNVTDKVDEKHPYEDVVDCLIYLYLMTDTDTDTGFDDFAPVVNDPGRYVSPYFG